MWWFASTPVHIGCFLEQLIGKVFLFRRTYLSNLSLSYDRLCTLLHCHFRVFGITLFVAYRQAEFLQSERLRVFPDLTWLDLSERQFVAWLTFQSFGKHRAACAVRWGGRKLNCERGDRPPAHFAFICRLLIARIHLPWSAGLTPWFVPGAGGDASGRGGVRWVSGERETVKK